MKIQPIAQPNILRAYTGASPVSEKVQTETNRDEVTFSREAMDFSRALAEARDSIETRTAEERAHIDEITLAIRQGVYHVSSEAIADRILESVFRK